MNKYELALVVNAKLEEEERAAVVEKDKGYVTRWRSRRVGQKTPCIRNSAYA